MGRTDEEQIFPVVPVNQTLMGNNIVLRVHVVVKMCFSYCHEDRILYRTLLATVYNCPNTENIGSIKLLSGEAAEPHMNFIDPIFSVLGQVYTV